MKGHQGFRMEVSPFRFFLGHKVISLKSKVGHPGRVAGTHFVLESDRLRFHCELLRSLAQCLREIFQSLSLVFLIYKIG